MEFPGLIKKAFGMADEQPLTRAARGAVGLNPTPGSGLETKKQAMQRHTGTASAEEFLNAPSVLDSIKTPEAEVGESGFLEKFAPKLHEKLVGMDASPEEKAEAARQIMKEKIDSDPDSIFHFFGVEKLKDMFRSIGDQFAPAQPDMSGNPVPGQPMNAYQGTQEIMQNPDQY